MTERFAIYYAPAAESPLWARACAWLGRDPAGGAPAAPPLPREKLHPLTVSARKYGFHATIKAPMALAEGRDGAALHAALADFAQNHAPVESGPLQVASLEGFLAIVPQRQSARLTDFAFAVVEAFEPFRAPLGDADRRRRRIETMPQRQAELMQAYGYPYVAEQFQFHMTLTDRLGPEDHAALLEAARAWFAPVLAAPLVLDRLVLFHQPAADAPFIRLADCPLSAKP